MARVAGYNGNCFVGAQLVHACDVVWDETSDANVTAVLDETDYKVGTGSNRFEQAAGLGVTTLMGSDDVVLPTLASYTVLYCWAKANVAGILLDTYRIQLDNVANCAAPQVEVSLPALTINVWKFCICTVVAGTFTNATLPISVGIYLQGPPDPGVANLWIDHISAAKEVLGIREWSLDAAAGVVDSSGFSDGQDKVFTVVSKEWSGSFNGFKDGAPLAIGTVVALELMEQDTVLPLVPTASWRGSAIITNVTPASTVDGLVTYNYTFQGIHALEWPTT